MTVPKAAPTKPPETLAEVDFRVSELWASSLEWLQSHWIQVIIAGAIATAIVVGLYTLRGFGKKWAGPDRKRGDWLTILGRVLCKTTTFFIVMSAVALVDGYAATPPMLSRVIGFLFTIAAVFQGAIWARELIIGVIEHKTSSSDYHGQAVVNALGLIQLLVSVVVFAIAAIVLLDNVGVNVTGLVAGLGVGGIAVGLAAQGIFEDLFAALAIIFDRPFSKGEKIAFDDRTGTVEAIGLKSTRIRSDNGELIVIANKNLLDKEILNVTHRNHIRLTFTIGVAYETPTGTLARVPAILKELIEAEGGTAARAGFEAFGASSLDFAVQVDILGSDWTVAHPLRDRLMVSIIKRFAEEGISIPYPAQTSFTAAPDGRLIMPYPDESLRVDTAVAAR